MWYIVVYSYAGTTDYNLLVNINDPGLAGAQTDLTGQFYGYDNPQKQLPAGRIE